MDHGLKDWDAYPSNFIRITAAIRWSREQMENIRQAIERAKALGFENEPQPASQGSNGPRVRDELAANRPIAFNPRNQETELDCAWLESKRIVAYNSVDLRSRSFDMLRTQVLQSMDLKDWKFLAVTSPTAGCGKTLTAINLALSMARQAERSVLLVDMDFQKPQVAKTLGLTCPVGILSVLHGQSTLASSVVQVRVDKCQMLVLPTEAATSSSSEWMASHAMSSLLQDIRRNYHSRIVILDLPPLLTSDDVIAVVPRLDCVLLVAAVGTSTVSEIKQCNRHLQSSDVVRVVVNKVEEHGTRYYYGAAPHLR
jgi:protein-tyrosine kinase